MSADLSNWREPPHNIWAFHNVDKIVSTHIVRKGENESPLKNNTRSLDSFSMQQGSSPKLDLASFISHTNTDGFVILHKGEVVYEHYDHENDAGSKHIIMSMTKSVTGLIAGILSTRGQLDLTASIKHYVPSASPLYDNVTVQELLDMRTGVKSDDNRHEYRAAAGWNPLRGDEDANTLHQFIEKLEADLDKSKGFNYSSVNTDLLGWVIEQATGKKLSTLISELLWQPMGAESDALITVDCEGSARAAGGLCATVRDIARIGQLLADGGRDIVPKAWIDDMLHGGDTEAWAKGTFGVAFGEVLEKAAYRDCWVADMERKTLIALGIFGQQLSVDLENGIVIAKTSSMAGPADFAKVKLQTAAFQELRRVLLE